MFSTFKVNFTLGVLSAMTIAIALLVDFTLLPAILIIMDSKKSSVRSDLMKPKNVLATIAVVVMAISASSVVKAQDDKGLWVAKQIDSVNDGFVNQTADVQMILTNKLGQNPSRAMKIKTLEVKTDGDKSLTIFNSPRDVKGTAFLSFSHVKEDDDQWLYLPALRRVKRISSNNKSGPFMGSEFAYEDLSSQEVDKYTYKYIQEDIIDGNAGHIIERYPVDKKSGYTKQIVYVDAKEWRVHKIQFYDRKSELLKVLEFKKYQKYPNKKWRADEFSMKNVQTGKSTLLKWSNYKFNQDISTRDFDKNALKRIR
jgi:outer membrane lipoprotein-sorting protein